jgi:hypothetical protein
VAAFLGKVRWGEIDSDAAGRKRETRRHQPRPDPLAGFRHDLVGKAHHIERGKAGRHLHLDIDRASLDALERHCCDPLDHACPCLAGPDISLCAGKEQ